MAPRYSYRVKELGNISKVVAVNKDLSSHRHSVIGRCIVTSGRELSDLGTVLNADA